MAGHIVLFISGMSISVRMSLRSVLHLAQLERRAGKQGVTGSIPGLDTYFHFDFFAYFPLLIVLRALCSKRSI